ncbi:uncharacterized protein LOC127867311 [Dreissena polymorpha]|uniref:Uncharacterized protein n=1 Tax=Dreissena polymorpha TaxID=45954 RepID=A0A9D4RFD4_DREPO|nr:uncharacterized protein LOC127867311 [Dreissena polymorpha]XP_052264345.1 uncharacterized protein LOC127867311 [Dreissena polymorpha]XP_052264346.1 uncharacterized protein LOC127867311 [Dreissena polymorpha]XP_052264347.1 uncharacterized protein LOC127867311 [Dreissena polymorpha]XP_052264348.1 uncharacterized protein LOC127867311 [Dreissena polymorpha]XP_052264349.1 uncharacterized protein LOC127867311 [Dreissena polymorpha]KAH3866476.1 hypothetical protein DPMN_029540 [Dreissena polymorp
MMEIPVYQMTAVVSVLLLHVRVSQAKNITISISSVSSNCGSPLGMVCECEGDGAIFYFKNKTSVEYIAECQFTNGPHAQLMNGALNSSYTIERNYSSCILTVTSLTYDLSGTYICKELFAETNYVTHNVSCTDTTSTGRETSLPIGLIIGLAIIGLFVIVFIVGLIYTRKLRRTNDVLTQSYMSPPRNRPESVAEENTLNNHSENPGLPLNDTHSSTSFQFDHTGRVESKSYSPQKQGCRRLKFETVCDRSRYSTDFDEKKENEEIDNTLVIGDVVNENTVNGNETVNQPVNNTDAPTYTLTKELLEEIQKQDAETNQCRGIPDFTEQEINHEDTCTSPSQRFLKQKTNDMRKELHELSNRKLITKGGDQLS